MHAIAMIAGAVERYESAVERYVAQRKPESFESDLAEFHAARESLIDVIAAECGGLKPPPRGTLYGKPVPLASVRHGGKIYIATFDDLMRDDGPILVILNASACL